MTLVARPDLARTVSGWLWNEFWRRDGYALDQTLAVVNASVASFGPPQTFVLLVGGQPIATASLAAQDLDERPDLTPWLAGVYVVPEARGRGYASRLIEVVEEACLAARIPTAWLYTSTAERLYQQAGWRVVDTVQRSHRGAVSLMRKDFPMPALMAGSR